MNKIINLLFKFSILLQILWGAHAWITWEFHYIALLFFFIISLVYAIVNNINLFIDFRKPFVVLILFIAFVLCSRFRLFLPISIFVRVFPIWVLLCDTKKYEILNFVVNAIIFILVPGIIIQIILGFVSIPGIPIQFKNRETYIFLNYIFLIKEVSFLGTIQAYRFNSIFLEPGYLGTLLSFLLYAVEFNFSKKKNLILLISLIMTFSLAGYVTTIIGYLCCLFTKRSPISKYIIYFAVLIISFFVIEVYNDGDNHINNLIISRLEYDKEKGIVGNNRFGEAADFYYHKVVTSPDLWLNGLGVDEVNRINGDNSFVDRDNSIHGAGYKIFIITHGFIPILFYLWFYIQVGLLCTRDSRYVFGFVLLLILTFLQAGFPESYSWLYPFILGNINHQYIKSYSRQKNIKLEF